MRLAAVQFALLGRRQHNPLVMPTLSRDIVLTPSTQRWLRRIGVWQMSGGAISVVGFLDSFGRLPSFGGWSVVVVGVGLGLSVLAILAGRALYQLRAVGIRPSLLVQAVQLCGLATSTSLVQLTLGPYVFLTLRWEYGVSLQAGFVPQLQFHVDTTYDITPGIAINCLALCCFTRLLLTRLVPLRPDAESAGDGARNAGAPSGTDLKPN